MAWPQKKDPAQDVWLSRVWPTPDSPPLSAHRPLRPDTSAQSEGAPPRVEGSASSLTGTGEGLTPLRNAVLRLRQGRLKATPDRDEPPPKVSPRPVRARQLTLLEWRRGSTGQAPKPTVAAEARPWWRRANWGLVFSLAALGVAAVLILPDLIASARDGLGMMGVSAPSPGLLSVEERDAPRGDEPQPVDAMVASAPTKAEGGGAAVAVDGTASVAEATEAHSPTAAPVAEVSAPTPEPAPRPVPLLLAQTHPDLALSARGALVAGQEELYAWNAGPARPVAGLTKLMAAMVYLDTRPDLSEVITITSADLAHGGASARLAPGWKYHARELLTSILVGSENVGVEALVRSTGIGRDEFLIRMAEKAQVIGMTEAAFYDPTGLDPRNSASPRDVSLMVEAAARYPQIRSQTARRSAEINAVGRSATVSVRNGSPLLSKSQWRVGAGKAGYTDEAGYCLASVIIVPGIGEVRVVVLGAGSRTAALRDVEQMLEYLNRSRSAG